MLKDTEHHFIVSFCRDGSAPYLTQQIYMVDDGLVGGKPESNRSLHVIVRLALRPFERITIEGLYLDVGIVFASEQSGAVG